MNMTLLRSLCECCGTSGRESAVRDLIRAELDRKGIPAEWIRTDRLGNLLVHIPGQQSAKRKIMFSAHMDEVALMVTYIYDDGTLAFDTVGGISAAAVIGRQVQVGKDRIPGVIGTKPVHLLSKTERDQPADMHKLFCDIGTGSKEETMQLVRPGDIIYFCGDLREFGDGSVIGKAIDDRFGCAVLLELIRPDLPYGADFAFLVQEEVGLRGAGVAAAQIDPDIAVIFEATTAADIPGSDGADRVCELGGGTVISFMDGRTIYDKQLYDFADRLCEENGIRRQTKTKIAGGNDAGAIQSAADGVRVLAVSVPCRYLHSPLSVIRKSDGEACEMLARRLLETLPVIGEDAL